MNTRDPNSRIPANDNEVQLALDLQLPASAEGSVRVAGQAEGATEPVLPQASAPAEPAGGTPGGTAAAPPEGAAGPGETASIHSLKEERIMRDLRTQQLGEFMDEAVKLKRDRRLMIEISSGEEHREDMYISQESKILGDFVKLLLASHKHREFLDKDR